MSPLVRILLLEDAAAADWRLGFSSVTELGLRDRTMVVNDAAQALHYLRAEGTFQNRPLGLPAVVAVGPSLSAMAALAFLSEVRSDPRLRRLPLVLIFAAPDADTIRVAYEHGANGLIRDRDDVTARAECCTALALYWGAANHPPPGCVPPP